MAAYGEDSSRSALTFMPPVTREMVSRPLESPRLAYDTILYFHIPTSLKGVPALFLSGSWIGSNVREIGDMDEGVVEGSEDACNAENELAWYGILVSRCIALLLLLMTDPRGPVGRAGRSPAGGLRSSLEAFCRLCCVSSQVLSLTLKKRSSIEAARISN